METQDALQSPQCSRSSSNGFIRSICSEESLKISGIWHPKRRSSKYVREDHISSIPSASASPKCQKPQGIRTLFHPEIFRVFFGEENLKWNQRFLTVKTGHKLLNQIPLCKQIIDPQVTFSAKHKHHHRFFSGNFFWLDFFCLFPWFPGKHQKWSTNQTPSNPEFESGLENFRVEGKKPIFQSTLPVQYWVNCTSCHYFLGGNAAFGGYP